MNRVNLSGLKQVVSLKIKDIVVKLSTNFLPLRDLPFWGEKDMDCIPEKNP